MGTTVCFGEQSWQFLSLSLLHVSIACCIVSLRVTVACVLMFVGIRWILSTTSIENIVLNCAALSFVMDVDELLFTNMLTARVQRAVTTLLPLSQSLFRMEGHLRPLFVYAAVIIVMCFALPSLSGTMAHMDDLRFVLCGGNQDFVYAESSSFGWLALQQVETFSESADLTFSYHGLEEAVWAPSLDNLTLSWLAEDDLFFEYTRVASVGVLSAMFGGCTDDNFPWANTEAHFAYTLEVEAATCSDPVVLSACASTGYPFVRFACPVTCGCREPRSYLWLNGVEFGCNTMCASTDEYQESLHAISCTSPTAAELQANEAWNRLVESYLGVGFEFLLNRSEGASGLTEQGCGYVTGREREFCIETGEHQSLARWCPVECGCRVPTFTEQENWYPSECPPQCTAWRTRFWAQVTEQPCADSQAADFSDSYSGTLLTQHLDTFHHVFTEDLRDLVQTNLPLQGCDFFGTASYAHMCHFPFFMTAVCPVACGCITEPDQFACAVSCASVNATEH